MLQSIEQPSADGGVWSRYLDLCKEGPTSEWINTPVGAYRVYILDTDAPGAVEGELEPNEYEQVQLRYGTHVRLPHPLRGDGTLFVGDETCPPPCSGFAHTGVPGAEEYPPVAAPEAGGRSLRGLQVAESGVRVRRTQYAPPSGAFGRTLTLVTNPQSAPGPVTVPLDTVLGLEQGPGTVVTPGGGDVDPSKPWVVVRHASGLQGLVIGGALAPEAFDLVDEPETDPSLEARHTLSVEPDDSLALLTYTLVATGDDTAPLEARATALAALTEPSALFGLTNEERAAIVNFAVPPAGDVRVSVAFELAPVIGAHVGVIDGTGSLVVEATTASDGTAFFAGLPPGSYSIVAVDESGRPGRTEVEVTAGTTAGDTVFAPIELLADGALGGVDAHAQWTGSGDDAAGVQVALEAEGWSPVWRPTGETDASGHLGFGLVPPGTVAVRALPTTLGVETPVDVVAGAILPAQLVLEPFASLTGQVTAGDGATPVANAPVATIDASSGDVLASGRTDESGSYRLDGVRPGPAGVLVRAASPYDATVTVESSTLTPDVPGSYAVDVLTLRVGVITGEVQRAEGGVPHPVVLASDSTGRSILAERADEYGNFQIVGVAAGQVTVVVIDSATGERDGQTLELDTGSPEWLWFFLGPVPQ